MSKHERRVERIYGELTAKERARLVLADYKAGREPDHRLRWTAPDDQAEEFARLVRKLKATNEAASWLALAWQARLNEIGALRGWYGTLRLWGTTAWEASWYLTLHDREPITASERERRVEALRSETMTVPELAEYLVQLEEDDGDEELSEREGKRALEEKKREVRKAIADGALNAVKHGRTTVVELGSVSDWRGEEVPVLAEYGVDVEVVPDDQSEAIEPKRAARERLQHDLDNAPIGHGLQTDPRGHEPSRRMEEVATIIAADLCARFMALWRELTAAERVAAEVGRDFAGDDPLEESLREAISAMLERLEDMRPWLEEFAGDLDLDGPSEESTDAMRQLLLHGVDWS